MARLLYLCTFVQLLVSSVMGNAPFDFASTCVNPTNFRIVPPAVEDNVCVLMDSRYYVNLLGFRGVWRSFETDSNSGTWSQGLGGICTYQSRSCTYTRRQPQSNYLVTQFINSRTVRNSPDAVNEVQIDVAYRFTGGVYERAFDLLYFETDDSTNIQASLDPSNYKLLEAYHPTTSMFTGKRTFSFKTTERRGFYISVRENGTCLSLTHLRVYTYCCKPQTVGLVTYPLTFAPAGSSSSPTMGEGQCAERSTAQDTTGSVASCLSVSAGRSTLLDVQCGQMGTWNLSRDCSCDPGYILTATRGSNRCTVCPVNTYKSTSSNVDKCLSCPLNSESGQGSSCCDCIDGFFRAAAETSDIPCTASPSKPLNVRVLGTGSNSITVAWDAPLSTGGRSDISYSIEYQESSQLFRGYLSAGTVNSSSDRSFVINQLSPVSEYTIRVTAENGVSDQDPGSREGRTAVTMGETTEGVPGKIEVFKNTRGNTFTWQPPVEANGVITGFFCRISREGEAGAEVLIELGPFEFCFSPIPENIPPGSLPVQIQVAAGTAVGVGELSNPLPLEIETQKSCPSLTNPSNGEVVVMSSLVGGRARYFCNNGFRLRGSSSRVCQANESWSGNTPSCESIFCGSLSNLSNALVSFSDGTRLNSIATYLCVEGYKPAGGDFLRFCRTDGTWTGRELVCDRVQPSPTPELPTPAQERLECSRLEPPENGAVSPVTVFAGSVANYTCNSGYSLIGNSERECRLTTEWTGTAPTCRVNSCDALEDIENGRVTRIGQFLGAFAIFECNDPYVLEGSSFRQCINGEWTGTPAMCRAPTCQNQGEEFSTCASSCRPTCANPTPLCLTVCRPGCTCPQGLVFNQVQSRCVNMNDCPAEEVTFELNGQTYTNGSRIRLTNIGENNNAILFRTDYTRCCQAQRIGECYAPDGSQVGIRVNRNELYRNRGLQLIRLNRQSQFTSAAVPGLYCCEVPVSNNESTNVCVDIAV